MSELRYAEIVEQFVPDDVDWDDFRVFFEVVRHGSFNKAAAKLKMTQPTVSRRLLRLENAIGVKLFDRDRRGPRLTYDGQRIYRGASAAQLALTRAANQAAPTADRAGGECKLLMGDGIASYWMTRFLAPFFGRYPDIELKLFGSQDVSAERRAVFDLDVHYGAPVMGDAVSIQVATLHLIPFASRAYLARHGTPQAVKDLGRHRLMDLAIHLADMSSWANWSREEAATHTVLFTNLSACLADSVRHGAGIALLPTYAPLVDEDFVPLDIGVRFQMPVYISHHRHATTKWPVRATLDFLRSHVFDAEAMPWFGETFAGPAADWRERLSGLLERAAEPARPGFAAPDGV